MCWLVHCFRRSPRGGLDCFALFGGKERECRLRGDHPSAWREYDNDETKFKRTSFPPFVEPTGLFSLTMKEISHTSDL